MNMPSSIQRAVLIPPLVNGDRLTAEEFDRRYEAMPDVKKAELIEGVVYMGSPVSIAHGSAHLELGGWVNTYRVFTPGVQGGDNTSIHLDVGENRPQPDLYLRILPELGGRSRNTEDGKYVLGSPELVVEAALTSASYDLHDKLRAFEGNGVQEYLAWRVEDCAVDWFALRAGGYKPIRPDKEGIVQSKVLPGLWLNVPALLREDSSAVFDTLQAGLRSAEHAAFVAKLARRAKKKS
jgi:Uma2 family endonuclease